MNLTADIFQSRRQELRSRLQEDDVALFFSAPPSVKSNSVHHRYRQDSDFFYLTGFEEENAALVVTKEKDLLYLQPKDKTRETWDGPRLGVENAVTRLAVTEAKTFEDFSKDLSDLLKNKSTLYYNFGIDPMRDARVLGTAAEVLRKTRSGDYGPSAIMSPSILLHEMRLIKSQLETALLLECARITENGHRALWKTARAGMREYELEAILQFEFKREGAGEAYPSIVASGPNACVLHHIRNDRVLLEGDLVLVDAGADKDYMNADVTRCFPVSGRFSPEQRDVYQAVLDAQKNAIALTTRGSSMEAVHQATVRRLARSLVDLGALSGSVDEILENKKHQNFFMHRTGHYLGVDVHDAGPYYDRGRPRELKDGVVCTVEPGLYFAAGDENAPAFLRGIGVRIEDDVLVRGDQPLVLTSGIPKELSAIETLREEALAVREFSLKGNI